jgi:hypothetical protein
MITITVTRLSTDSLGLRDDQKSVPQHLLDVALAVRRLHEHVLVRHVGLARLPRVRLTQGLAEIVAHPLDHPPRGRQIESLLVLVAGDDPFRLFPQGGVEDRGGRSVRRTRRDLEIEAERVAADGAAPATAVGRHVEHRLRAYPVDAVRGRAVVEALVEEVHVVDLQDRTLLVVLRLRDSRLNKCEDRAGGRTLSVFTLTCLFLSTGALFLRHVNVTLVLLGSRFCTSQTSLTSLAPGSAVTFSIGLVKTRVEFVEVLRAVMMSSSSYSSYSLSLPNTEIEIKLNMYLEKMFTQKYRVFKFILKVGVEESIVNAPWITDQLFKSNLTFCVVCADYEWCVHNRLFNSNFDGKF